MIRGFLFLALFTFSSMASANELLQKAAELNLAQDKTWLNLLHYRSGMFGTKSEIGDSRYYLSSEGRTDAQSELAATIKAFFIDPYSGISDQHPACRFPARYLYLKKKLNREIKVNCPKLQYYKDKMEAKGVALVFSSYFLDTPASAFGHTFLRFLKNPDKEESYELLDYSLNYAAVVTSSNAMIYAIMGLTGGFNGEFASLPHFYKVREYNDHESRDLWSYELNITNDQLDMIIAHSWELGQVPVPYYYLTANCSYFMLALLDVADPNWRLVERTPHFVIPVDTLKSVAQVPGLIKKVHYRPSKRKVFEKRLSSLSSEDKDLLQKAYDQNDIKIFDSISDIQHKAKLLDTFIDMWDYKNSKAITKEDNETLQKKNQFLIARSQISTPSQKLIGETPSLENPLLGHGSRRLSAGIGYHETRKNFFDFEFRFTLHDFFDSLIGQNPLATMEMGRFKLRYYADKKKAPHQWRFQEAYLLNVQSLADFREFFRAMSWRFKLGLRTIEDRSCDACQVAHTSLGVGISRSKMNHILSLLIATEVDAAKDYGPHNYHIGLGPKLFWRYQILNKASFGLLADYKRRFVNDRFQETWSLGPQSRFYMANEWSMDLKGEWTDRAYLGTLSLLKTF